MQYLTNITRQLNILGMLYLEAVKNNQMRISSSPDYNINNTVNSIFVNCQFKPCWLDDHQTQISRTRFVYFWATVHYRDVYCIDEMLTALSGWNM